jgi:hypothetical protein
MPDQTKSGLSGGAIAGIVLVTGALGAGVLLYEYEQSKTREYNTILQDYMAELQDLITYQANSPTSAGIQEKKDALNIKAAKLATLNTSWVTNVTNGAKGVFASAGMNLILPVSILVGGIALIYLAPKIIDEIYRNRPKGGGGGTYTAHDRRTFTTLASLQAYESQFQGSSDTVSVASAQSYFTTMAQWVQDSTAATSEVYTSAYQNWTSLSGQQRVSLGAGLEGLFGMGVITDPSVAAIAALLFAP